MMKNFYFKQLLTVLLLLCSTIASANDFEVEGIYYDITDATAKYVEVTHKGQYSHSYRNEYCDTVTIPSSVTYRGVTYTVTSIGSEAFYDCYGLTSVVIPNSVTNIGEGAFMGCSGLTSIVIPNSVATIEKNAFYDCTSLKELYIEDGTTTLSLKNQSYIADVGDYPIFRNCPLETLYLGRNLSYKLKKDDEKTVISPFSNKTKLSSVNIGKDVTIIYYYMFYGCSNLKTISIPNNVKEISSCVFEGCTSLKNVVFEDGNEPLKLGNNDSSVGLFGYCPLATCYIGRNLSYSTAPFYNFYRDYNTYLENITISNFVTVLPTTLFKFCSALISVTIPNSVTTIEDNVFWKCCSLTEITSLIPAESLYKLSSSVFRDVDKNTCTLYVPAGAKETYAATEGWKDFTNIVELEAPGINGTCGDNATWNLYNGVLTISGTGAMYDYTSDSPAPWYDYKDEITSVIIEDGVTSLGNCAFYGYSNLASVTIGNSVTRIGYDVFEACISLKSIEIPNSVTSIGEWAFYGCYSLTNITIPESVTSIGNYAFSSCSGLTSIVVKEGNTVYDSRNNCNAIIETATNTLVVGCKNTIIPDGITSIGNNAFCECSSLTSIEIPNSVTSIGREAFSDCSGLTSIVIPRSVTSIGNYAFSYCSSLTSITSLIPADKLFAIHSSVFSNVNKNTCTLYVPAGAKSTYKATEGWKNFTNIVELEAPGINGTCGDNLTWNLYNGVLTISGTGAMYDYADSPAPWYDYKDEITSVVINDGITSIGSVAFSGCYGLTSIEIPNSVTSVGDRAFYDCYGLTSIEIPNSVTSVGDRAFYDCYGLTSVVIPNSVTNIGEGAFYNCVDLTSIEIPNSVTSIGEDAFYNCDGLTSIEIPNSVTNIGEGAFYNCDGLTSIEIPNSVTSIGVYAFSDCSGLTSIVVKEGNTVYDSRNNCNAIIETATNTLVTGCKNTIIPDGITSIGKYAFYICRNLTSIEIPNSVTSIGENAFFNCFGLKEVHITDLAAWCNIDFGDYNSNPLYYAENLYLNETLVTDLVIPDSVTEIKGYAFYYFKSLTSINIPNSVTSIGESAFYHCTSLTSITIPGSVTSIGRGAFYDCYGLTSITIPGSVTSIGNYAFSGCSSLKSITSLIPAENLFAIDSNTFQNVDKNTCTLYVPAGAKETYAATEGWKDFTNIVELEAPGINGTCGDNATWSLVDGVLTISGTGAMYDYTSDSPAPWNSQKSEITSVIIEDGVTSIGNDAFLGCSSLTSVTIPNSVTSIGDYAFNKCSSLTSITIPNSVTSIGKDAFKGCYGIASIKIPNGITTIGDGAFRGCDKLERISVSNGNTTYDSRDNCNAIIETATNTLITGCKNTIIPNSVTSIGNYAFADCPLTSIIIPESVTSIGDYAFFDCRSLRSVTIPNSVTTIGNNAFFFCCDLTNITIPESVTTIGNYAFGSCSSLKSITIPNSVTSIGDDAFSGCKALASITIPKSVTSIGGYAFAFCDSLTSITSLIPADKLFAIDSSVFNYVDKNTCTLYVPAGAKATYEATEGWKDFTNIVELVNPACGDNATWSLVDGVLTITGTGAMYDYTTDSPAPWDSQKSEITSVIIEEGITSLGNYAFRGCSNLASASIPVSTTRLGMYLFADCPALKGITIPKNVKSVGNCVFENCSGLASITIPNGITTIGYNAFYGCTSLASVTLPKSITTIGTSAFRGCTSLAKITLPDAITSIGISAFRGCAKLTTITIPAGVTSIGDYAFYGCSGFTSVTSLIAADKLFAVNGAFIGVDKNRCTLFVPSGAVDTYAAIADWSTFTSIEETSFDVKIGSAGYSTLYLGYAVRRPDGVKAYYITQLNNNYAMLEPVWDYIPANTGVILQAEPDTYTFVHTDKKVSAITDNMLRGTTVDAEIPVDANTKYYALGRVDGVVGLYRATTSGGVFFNNANKAYLPLAEAQQSARFTLSFPDGTTTDIESVFGSDSEEVIYDLSGRRIDEIKEHGVYIINGKKVVR